MQQGRHRICSAAFHVAAIAAPAGGFTALQRAPFRAAGRLTATVVIVQHLDRRRAGLIPDIPGRHAGLPETQAASSGLCGPAPGASRRPYGP